MVRETITFPCITGLHLRAASLLCKTAVKYDSRITFEHKTGCSDAKSILSILGGCVKYGEEMTLVCDGHDEEEAMNSLLILIHNNFGD